MNDSAPPFSAEPDAQFAERLELELLDRLLAGSAASVAGSDATSRVRAFVSDERGHEPIVKSPTASDRPRGSRRRRRIAGGTAAAVAAAASVAILALWSEGDDPRSVFAGRGGRPGQPSTPAAGPVLPLRVPGLAAGLGLPASDKAWISRVTVGGPGLVAVGSARAPKGRRDAAVWTSADGTTWSRVPDDHAVFGGRGIQEMNDVTPGGPGLVAVGRASSIVGSDTYAVAAVWTSVDGITWSRVAHDDAVFGRATGKPNDIFSMSAVTTGGPGLVAVGGRGGESDHVVSSGQYIFNRSVGAVWTSTNGTTWKRVPHDRGVFGEWHARAHSGLSASMWDVTTGGPGLVAVGIVYRGEPGGAGAVWTSADGVDWTLADDQIEGSLAAVTAGGPGLVAVGDAVEIPPPSPAMEHLMAAVWTSTDGTTWTRVPPQPEVLGGPGFQALSAVAVGGPGLVAVGESQEGLTAWTSADGITWSRASEDPDLWAGNTIETVLRLYGFRGR